MDDSTRRELRALKAYAIVSSTMLTILCFSAFQSNVQGRTKFEEIDVERINIVEKDGKYRMVLSNKSRSIGPIYKGKPFGYAGGNRPGIIFFNDEGTENGGLTFGGQRGADGRYRASSGFSFDQFNQDQILYFQYSDNNGQRRTGMTIADRADVDIYDLIAERDSIMKIPEGPVRTAALEKFAGPRNGVPLFAQRVYVGRDPSKSAVLDLSDPMGKPRIRLKVDSLGTPSLEFMDAAGNVTARLPEARRD